jgi:competence protein ComEA
MKLNRSNVGMLLFGLIWGAILTFVGMTLLKQTQPAPLVILPPEPTATLPPTATPGPIRVYVSGAVRTTAVLTLPPNSIVQQAIEAAGGFAASADRAVVNLAQPLSDGAHIYVPAVGEAMPLSIPSLSMGSGREVTAVFPNLDSGLTNINRADVVQLATLPGIGPSTAEKIVAHRREHGLFPSIEAIMDVTGIGPAKFDQIKELITVADN